MVAAIGDIYAAPWGRYYVARIANDQVTLRSLERVAAVVHKVLPEGYVATGEVMGSDTVPRRADPQNGLNRGGVGRPVRSEATIGEAVESDGSASSSCGASDKPLDAARPPGRTGGDLIGEAIAAVRAIAIALPDPPTLGATRPGCARGGWGPTWIPCLNLGHCWFIAEVHGSLYCENCRVGKPLVVVGDATAIEEIKSALERGDRARVAELVKFRPGGGGSSSFFLPPASPVSAIPSGGLFSTASGSLTEPLDAVSPAEAMVLPSGPLGHGGGPPVVDPQSVHPALPGTDEAKASLPQVDVPPPSRENSSAKDETADFSWRPRTFVPRDLADWKEFAAERAAIRQYECWPTLEEAERPGRREEANRFARELAGPAPRSRAA